MPRADFRRPLGVTIAALLFLISSLLTLGVLVLGLLEPAWIFSLHALRGDILNARNHAEAHFVVAAMYAAMAVGLWRLPMWARLAVRGIECIWRLGADSTRSGLTHRLILSLDPERRKNRLANPSGRRDLGGVAVRRAQAPREGDRGLQPASGRKSGRRVEGRSSCPFSCSRHSLSDRPLESGNPGELVADPGRRRTAFGDSSH